MNAMNNPIPLGMAFFKFVGMDFNIASLTLNNENTMNKIPSKNTAVRATSTLYFIEITTVNVKKALRPMPGASAIGMFAKSPIKRQATAAETAVAVNTAPLSNPAMPKSSGFTARIYAIERNIVTPAIISVVAVVPLSFNLNNRFSNELFVKPFISLFFYNLFFARILFARHFTFCEYKYLNVIRISKKDVLIKK